MKKKLRDVTQPMYEWLSEGMHTFSVTTLHPIGWGFDKFHRGFLSPQRNSKALLSEHEHPVILVHGIFHNSTAFYQLEKSLRRCSFQSIHSVELWTSLNSIEDLANQLKREAHEILEQNERLRRYSKSPLKLRLVAHSLGGMVSRLALCDPEFAELVDKVIFLGVPHQGNPLFRFRFPSCLRELVAGSPTMKRLQEIPLPGRIHYHNIRGDLDIVAPARLTYLPTVPNLSFQGVGHAGLLSNPQVLHSVVEILESPFYDSGSETHVG